MKSIFYLGSFLILLLTFPIMAQEESGKIKIKITNENGVIEREYTSAEAAANDPELKEMGVEIESRDGGIRMMSKGSGTQSVVIQQNSGRDGNQMYIEQRSSRTDSMDIGHHPRPPHPPGDFNEEDIFRSEEHVRIMQMRDSLMSRHHERREDRMQAIEERRKEMQRRMEERRELDRPERRGRPGRAQQLIIIEDLSKQEAGNLGIRNAKLQLEDLRITPNPEEESLSLRFRTNSKGQVRIMFTRQDGRLLVDREFSLVDNNFEETIELESFEKDTYYLQIIQDKKVLGRKIRVE